MAQTIDKIDTHVTDALNRLLEHYKSKVKTRGVITAMGEQFQDMEDVVHSLSTGRTLANSVGVQLDLMGTIIGLSREAGQSDDNYRILLYVKIGQNTSQGTSEKIISVFKLLTGASFVYFQNLNRASVLIEVDKDIDPTNDPDVVAFIYLNMQKVVAGGVRIDYIICFSPDDDSFAFAGTNVDQPALGFGSTVDVNQGGKLAMVHRLIIPFAFDGLSESSRGFGSVRDSLAGGTLVTT